MSQGDATAATFKNTHSVTPPETEVDFDLSNTDGHDWTDTDEFSFTISPAEGTSRPAARPCNRDRAEERGRQCIAAIKFGKIRHGCRNLWYEIRENAGNAAGMTYDEHAGDRRGDRLRTARAS
ncbi:MAG: Spy0128 family protein [Collinsella sp.]